MTDIFKAPDKDEAKRQSVLYTKIQARLALTLVGSLAALILLFIYVVVHFVIKLW